MLPPTPHPRGPELAYLSAKYCMSLVAVAPRALAFGHFQPAPWVGHTPAAGEVLRQSLRGWQEDAIGFSRKASPGVR